MLETVAGASSVSREISAWLSSFPARIASTTRCWFAVRKDAVEPGADMGTL
jgi:hypothetical protein